MCGLAGVILGTHNGIRRLCEVDTEVLVGLADEAAGLDAFLDSLHAARGELAAALVRPDRPGQTVLIRGNKPLALRHHPRWRALFYASEDRDLDAALAGKTVHDRPIPAMTGLPARVEDLNNSEPFPVTFVPESRRASLAGPCLPAGRSEHPDLFEPLPVFVHGTLRRGFPNHDRFCFDVLDVIPAWTTGLYALPYGFPAMIPAGDGRVIGELLTFPDPDRPLLLRGAQARYGMHRVLGPIARAWCHAGVFRRADNIEHAVPVQDPSSKPALVTRIASCSASKGSFMNSMAVMSTGEVEGPIGKWRNHRIVSDIMKLIPQPLKRRHRKDRFRDAGARLRNASRDAGRRAGPFRGLGLKGCAEWNAVQYPGRHACSCDWRRHRRTRSGDRAPPGRD